MEKKITVEEFVNKYKSCKTKEEHEKCVNEIITRKYVPIIEKKLILQKMLEKSIVKDIDGVEHLDLFTSRINAAMAILILYTNLELKKNDDYNNSFFIDYDMLKKHNLFDVICECIGEVEIREFGYVNSLICDSYLDKINNTKYLIFSLISKFIDNFENITNISIDKLSTIINKE